MIIIPGLVFAQPMITTVVPQSTTIPEYEKFQIDINIFMANYTNPFNPYDIDVNAQFTGPSGQQYEINGFWDGSDWLVRFSPSEVGTWNYYAWANDYDRQDSSAVQSFTCVDSDHPGFVRLSDDNPHYLEYSDDTPFYGIGQCRPWFIYEQVPNIFTDMKAAGMNTLLYWMPDWDNMLVNNITGYDSYSMTNAAEIDQVVEDCEANDITLILTIWNHDEIRGAGHPWNVRPYYDEYNPFRLLVSPVNLFFTEDTSRYYQKWLYRYIIARWGYSRAIQQWHTVSEMNGTGNTAFNPNDPYDYRTLWMIWINNWFRDNDPFGHPVSASLSFDSMWDIGFQNMDLPQSHSYTYSNSSNGIAWAPLFASKHHDFWQNYQKPAYIGEFGTGNNNVMLNHVHYGVWSAFSAGAAITPLDWNDGGSWDDFTPEMYTDMSHFANFISDIDFIHWDFDIGNVSTTSNFYAWGMVGNEHAFAWLADRTPGEDIGSAPITFDFLSSGLWRADWYNTWSGEYVDVTYEIMDGPTTILSPPFRSDIALKLEAMTFQMEPIGLSLSDFPDDQGYQINVGWVRSIADTVGGTVQQYILERREDGGWIKIDTMFANYSLAYDITTIVLQNSSIGQEVWHIFRLGAEMSDNSIHYSPPDSVQAFDNLPPLIPINVQYQEHAIPHLEWTANNEVDFSHYTVYRSDVSGFEPSGETFLSHSDTNYYPIPTSTEIETYYYRIISSDIHGNTSNGSLEIEVILFLDHPVLLTFTDVPDDQGFALELGWIRSIEDSPGGLANTYLVDRKDAGTWFTIDSVSADNNMEYQRILPTLQNSIPSQSFWSTFRVGIHLTNGTIHYSVTDSAQSWDNTAPAAPTNLSFFEHDVPHFEWDIGDADLAYSSVYQSTLSGFTPGQESFITTVDTPYYEIIIPLDFQEDNLFFIISATDIHENISDYSDELDVEVNWLGSNNDPLPQVFSLSPNFPNPWNPITTISYSIPIAGYVKLTVYNIRGQHVIDLVNNDHSPGYYTVQWDGRNTARQLVSSGVYFYVLISNEYKAIRKLTILN